MNDRKSLWLVGVLTLSFWLITGAAWAAENNGQDESKKNAAERETKSLAAAEAKPKPAIRLATPSELERLYLDGRITAKEYQRKLADYKASIGASTNKDPNWQAVEALRQFAGKPTNSPVQPVPTATAKPAPAAAAPKPPTKQSTIAQPSAPAAEDKKITEVEAKFDDLIQKKAEREKSAQAAVTNAPAAAPKTKREKLDALLKALIDGKLTEKDYNEQRAKIVSEPE